MPPLENAEYDPLHTNHIEVFDGSMVHISPLFAAGKLLVSFRQLSAVAIINLESSEMECLLGPANVVFQHHRTPTPDGTILLFDDWRERSRL